MSWDLILVGGVPGTKPRAVLDKLIATLPAGDTALQDVEEVLVQLVNELVQHATTLTIPPSTSDEILGLYLSRLRQRWTLLDICWGLPRDMVMSLWHRSAMVALDELAKTPAVHRILKTHLVYYRVETFEFFSPLSLGALLRHPTAPQVARVVVFIDDIYDMYVRLSEDGEVFDYSKQLKEEHLHVQEIEDGMRKRKLLPENSAKALDDDAERYRIAISLVVRDLRKLLIWREKEILIGDSLAQEVGRPFYVIATKHPLSVGRAVLFGVPEQPSALLTYLSHPISRPRRAQIEDKTNRWPAFVDEYHEFIAAVLRRETPTTVVPIMPTAIDEYRFLTKKLLLSNSDLRPVPVELLVPALTTRWPLLDAQAKTLMYPLPDGVDYSSWERDKIARIFDPVLGKDGRRFINGEASFWRKLPLPILQQISGMLRTLVMNITQQMANRDHLLVRQCPGFLLYRPLHGEDGFSRGVGAEIKNWEGMVRAQAWIPDAPKRPILFMHDPSDLEQISKKEFSPYPIKQALVESVRKHAGITFRMDQLEGISFHADDWFEALGVGDESVIDGGDVTHSDQARLQTVREPIVSEMREVIRAQRESMETRGARDVPGAIWCSLRIDGLESSKNLPVGERPTFWDTVVRDALNDWLLRDEPLA